mgnify:CR=1 FL=1
MIVFALSSSRKETKKIYSFLNDQNGFCFDFESDISSVSWKNSENIIMNRVNFLEQKLYHNKFEKNKNSNIVGDVGFYFLPYVSLLIANFPHIKFICTKKNRKNTYNDIISDIKTNNSIFSRFIFLKKKYKNHWIEHDGKKWEKDYLLDKCYPKFEINNLKDSIEKYISLYNMEIKTLNKKYPKNLKVIYSDEIKSEYGKSKILSFLGV